MSHLGLPGRTGPPTNAKAVLAVSTLWAAPAAVVFGLLARQEIRRTGEAGWELATWGLWLGVARLALAAVCALVVAVTVLALLVLALLPVGG